MISDRSKSVAAFIACALWSASASAQQPATPAQTSRLTLTDAVQRSADDQLVEVFGPLKEGDVVAMRGTGEIRQGSLVTPGPAPLPANR